MTGHTDFIFLLTLRTQAEEIFGSKKKRSTKRSSQNVRHARLFTFLVWSIWRWVVMSSLSRTPFEL